MGGNRVRAREVKEEEAREGERGYHRCMRKERKVGNIWGFGCPVTYPCMLRNRRAGLGLRH